MGIGSKEGLNARPWIGTLLVAWSLVTACAVTLAAAWYSRTKDLEIVIAYLGAPFLVGLALFAFMGITLVVGRTKPSAAPPPPRPPGGERRGMMFGRK